MERIFIAAASLAGAVSVGADAVAQHYLGNDAARAALAGLGARYGMIHAAVLIGVTLLMSLPANAFGRAVLALAGWCFVLGLLCFCGGLFLHAAGHPSFAKIVPVGGVLFIAGWTALFLHAVSPRPLE
jgi:uncharacterized membrane protein YgdD (TMEM256/DUF423 family)